MKNNGIVFQIDQTNYITPTADIQEVVQYIPIHELPLAQPWLLGVMHLRGEIIPVTSLQQFLTSTGKQRHSHRKNQSKAATLILSHNGWTYGIEVPEIVGMEPIPEQFSSNRIDFDPESEDLPFIKDQYKNSDNQPRTIIDLIELVELNEFIHSCRI